MRRIFINLFVFEMHPKTERIFFLHQLLWYLSWDTKINKLIKAKPLQTHVELFLVYLLVKWPSTYLMSSRVQSTALKIG